MDKCVVHFVRRTKLAKTAKCHCTLHATRYGVSLIYHTVKTGRILHTDVAKGDVEDVETPLEAVEGGNEHLSRQVADVNDTPQCFTELMVQQSALPHTQIYFSS